MILSYALIKEIIWQRTTNFKVLLPVRVTVVMLLAPSRLVRFKTKIAPK